MSEIVEVTADFAGPTEAAPVAPVDPFDDYVGKLLDAIRGVRLVAQQKINALEAENADLRRQLNERG